MQVSNFNLRVYGLLIHEDKVLITHEHRAGLDMTKFPGGGLEKGEGIESCLKREFLEEMNVEIEVMGLFYVNEFLQISSFNEADQLISFYYFVKISEEQIELIDQLINRKNVEKNSQKFEWLLLDSIRVENFTFPIDRAVAQRLFEETR